MATDQFFIFSYRDSVKMKYKSTQINAGSFTGIVGLEPVLVAVNVG